MNAIEKMLFEQHQRELFQRVVSDNFSFVDNLIEQVDLDRNNIKLDKEDNEDALND